MYGKSRKKFKNNKQRQQVPVTSTWIWIRFPNTDPNPVGHGIWIQYGSGSKTQLFILHHVFICLKPVLL